MNKKQDKDSDADSIEPGMKVEASQGDLGEQDVSSPKVARVERDGTGRVESVVVAKGAIFRKELGVPIERVQKVEPPEGQQPGMVTIDVNEPELEELTAFGQEQLADEQDVLGQVEETLPTAEGMREREDKAILVTQGLLADEQKQEHEKNKAVNNALLRLLGPGFLGGMAGNDSSAVTAYSIDGAQNGIGHLWLLLISTPMYYATMYACAKIGRVTKQGFADVLREQYGRWVALIAALILIVANMALIAADLVAIGSGLQLITGLNWIWFVVPVGLILWDLTVFRNFEAIKKIFIAMSLVFVVYFATGILAHPVWREVLFNTFVPHMDLSFASISSAVALLGATISPYNIFWQVQGEKEEIRSGSPREQLRLASMDVGVGVVSGNLIAYSIILTTATTLFTHHRGIATAADAAVALTSLLGPFAKYLFAIGLIGAGLVAIPVLLAGTSYAVAGTFGWPYGLSKKPWQSEGFYLILSVALVISLLMALLRFDPIQLMFWANILGGMLAPILLVYLLFLVNNRQVMRGQRIHWAVNVGLVVAVLVMAAAAVLLFFGLATG